MSKTVNSLVFCYGVCLFMLGFIPLLGAGEEFLMLDNISEEYLQTNCHLNDEGLQMLAEKNL